MIENAKAKQSSKITLVSCKIIANLFLKKQLNSESHAIHFVFDNSCSLLLLLMLTIFASAESKVGGAGGYLWR